MAEPEKPDDSRSAGEELDDQQESRDAIQVPAIYATTVTVMSTDKAVRVAFGEAVAGSQKFHIAAAMDFDLARSLQRQLGVELDRREAGKAGSPSPNDDAA